MESIVIMPVSYSSVYRLAQSSGQEMRKLAVDFSPIDREAGDTDTAPPEASTRTVIVQLAPL